jgi:thioredoxin-related protein
MAGAAVCGCGVIGKFKPGGEEEEDKPFGPSGVPPHLRAPGTEGGGTAVSPGGNQPALPANFQITPDEDLIFTDPDNPDAIIPELSTLLAEQSTNRGPWEKSDTVARQRAMRENKALMIWFTDSGRSPLCKVLEEELFATPEFNNWAGENLVRLRVDSNLAALGRDNNLSIDEAEALRINVRNYVDSLRKRYRVMGSPAVVILDAEGRRINQYRGYRRGDADVLFGKIRYSESIAARNNAAWRKKMEERGYREWHDARGRVTIFARLVSYHQGSLVLVEPDGSQVRTRDAHLSTADKSWIAEEKRKRGL